MTTLLPRRKSGRKPSGRYTEHYMEIRRKSQRAAYYRNREMMLERSRQLRRVNAAKRDQAREVLEKQDIRREYSELVVVQDALSPIEVWLCEVFGHVSVKPTFHLRELIRKLPGAEIDKDIVPYDKELVEFNRLEYTARLRPIVEQWCKELDEKARKKSTTS